MKDRFETELAAKSFAVTKPEIKVSMNPVDISQERAVLEKQVKNIEDQIAASRAQGEQRLNQLRQE
jgi:hypothetical protein